MKRKKNLLCEEGRWSKGTERRKSGLDLLDGRKTIHDLLFFEDIVII